MASTRSLRSLRFLNIAMRARVLGFRIPSLSESCMVKINILQPTFCFTMCGSCFKSAHPGHRDVQDHRRRAYGGRRHRWLVCHWWLLRRSPSQGAIWTKACESPRELFRDRQRLRLLLSFLNCEQQCLRALSMAPPVSDHRPAGAEPKEKLFSRFLRLLCGSRVTIDSHVSSVTSRPTAAEDHELSVWISS